MSAFDLLRTFYVEVVLALLALVTLGLEGFKALSPRSHGLWLSAGVLGLAAFTACSATPPQLGPDALVAFPAHVQVARLLCLVATSIVLLQTAVHPASYHQRAAEHYVLLLLTSVGFNVSLAANDFIVLFVALELSTTGCYVLVAQGRQASLTIEAGVKYLIMGALSTAFLAFGLSYLIGLSGASSYDGVRAYLEVQPNGLGLVGVGLVLGSLFFKISAFPAQLWTPDVYQGAALPVTAFLATASKAVGFFVMLALLQRVFFVDAVVITRGLLLISAVTVLWGNLGALKQTEVPRLLGYSSIAHTGYVLLALATMSSRSTEAVTFYLVQYTFNNLACFFVLSSVAQHGGGTQARSLTGLHQRSPLLAWVMTGSLLSLAGIPPMSGFFGKFLLVTTVPDLSVHGVEYTVALCCALLGIVTSIVYYFRIIRQVWTTASVSVPRLTLSWGETLGVAGCGAVSLLLGLCPQLVWLRPPETWSVSRGASALVLVALACVGTGFVVGAIRSMRARDLIR